MEKSIKNYHYFSQSTFPVLVWIKAGFPKMPKVTKKHTFNRKTFMADAAKTVSEYRARTAGKYA